MQLFHFRPTHPGEHAFVVAETFEEACDKLRACRGDGEYRDNVIANMLAQEDGYEAVFYEVGDVAWAQVD